MVVGISKRNERTQDVLVFFCFFFHFKPFRRVTFHNGRKRYVGEKICFVLASTSKIVPKVLKRYEMRLGPAKKKHGM